MDKNYQIPLDTETNYLALLKNNNIQVLKILFPFNSPAELDRVQFINEPFKDQVEGVFSQKDLFDIRALDINKGNAFKKLCELKEYEPHQFIFYGDNYNDLELAKSVWYSVAMGNSVLELKKLRMQQQLLLLKMVFVNIFLPKYYQKNKLLSFYLKLKMFLNKFFL